MTTYAQHCSTHRSEQCKSTLEPGERCLNCGYTRPRSQVPFMDRYWINQPSTAQPVHRHHGRHVLAPRNLSDYDEEGSSVTVYFMSGPETGILIPKNALSQGWPSPYLPAQRPDEMKSSNPFEFEYQWLHIPTGTRGAHKQEFNCLADFAEKIALWNRSNPGVWQYWS